MASSVPSVEIQFARKLAANDVKDRDKAIKKLRKWLESREEYSFTPEEMLRIWKGLYYCFWFSDKPLVQEELAEKISGLIKSFGSNSVSSLLFAEKGLETLSREWFGLDRWRMDKFMMLTRRFLRQILFFASKDPVTNEKIVSIFEKVVIHRLPSQSHSVGFTLHFIDIYCTELAKVIGETENEVDLCFFRPFIQELSFGYDERVSSHIEEQVFQYLMRQSDLGIAYEEQGEEEEEEENEKDVGQDDEEEEKMEEEEQVENKEIGLCALDPRAGKVDVILPQLKVNWRRLSEELFKAGSQESVASSRRKMLYRLSKNFEELASDSYPLSTPIFDSYKAMKKSRSKSKKYAQKLVEENLSVLAKIQEEKDELKRWKKDEKKKKKQGLEKCQELDSEKSNNSKDKRENEENKKRKRDENEENCSSSHNSKSLSSSSLGNKKRKLSSKTEISSNFIQSNIIKEKKEGKATSLICVANKKKKRKEENVMKEEEVEEKKNEKEIFSSRQKNKKRKKKDKTKKKYIYNSQDSEDKNENDSSSMSPVSQTTSPVRKKPMGETLQPMVITHNGNSSSSSSSETKEKNSVSSQNDEVNEAGPRIKSLSSKIPTPIFLKKSKSKQKEERERKKEIKSSLIGKKRKEVKNLGKSGSSSSSLGKRVNFVMTKNKHQTLLEHNRSITQSPETPYIPDKMPKSGVLKVKLESPLVTPPPNPKVVQRNTLLNGKSSFLQRAMASDFFN